ncbi:MAG: hypothetical protein ACK4V1_06500 [Burkholderiaceae bacterium]
MWHPVAAEHRRGSDLAYRGTLVVVNVNVKQSRGPTSPESVETADAGSGPTDAAERERIAALRDRQVALVDLYKALGGGWSAEALARSR